MCSALLNVTNILGCGEDLTFQGFLRHEIYDSRPIFGKLVLGTACDPDVLQDDNWRCIAPLMLGGRKGK